MITRSAELVIAVLLSLLAGIISPQYQLVRQDPFASLSATLTTKQSAACDGEFAHLRCPEGSQVRGAFYVAFFRSGAPL